MNLARHMLDETNFGMRGLINKCHKKGDRALWKERIKEHAAAVVVYLELATAYGSLLYLLHLIPTCTIYLDVSQNYMVSY